MNKGNSSMEYEFISFPNRIKEVRERNRETQKDLAKELGIGESSLQNYEAGKRDVPGDVIVKLSRHFGCTADYLLKVNSVPHAVTNETRPVYGNIAAGSPLEMLPFVGEDAYVIPPILKEHPKGFFLRIRGNSMNLILLDGTLAYVDPFCDFKSGDVLAVNVNGDDATVKRVYFAGNTIVLHPESDDPSFEDRVISETDANAPSFRVIGKVVWHYLEHDYRLQRG